MANLIKQNIQHVYERISEACERSNRDPEDIELLLVTKTVEPERIRKAAENGFTEVGENRVQEAMRKVGQMSDEDLQLDWHFIGHLQSNKVNKVVRFASMVQSIDRMKIVRKMNRRLKKVDKTMDVLIQVNVSGEKSKYGLDPDNTMEFVREAAEYSRLNIRGLMTIGLFSTDWPKVRSGFRRLRGLRDQLMDEDISNVAMDYLSMGMTNDFEIAIEEGANMLRLGRAIFGERGHPDSYYWPDI